MNNIEGIISDLLAGYKKKYKEGFTSKEMNDIINFIQEKYEVDMDKFNDRMLGNTAMVIDNEIITYPIDLYHALLAGITGKSSYFD